MIASDGKSQATDGFCVRKFDPRFAAAVASWVGDERELFLLTPTTPPPLTPEKVLGWVRPGGRAYLGFRRGRRNPCVYGELNPMRLNDEHLWIGHVLTDPAERGQGVGGAFVRKLVDVGFDSLSAKRISLIVFPENEPAIRCYERVGFAFRGAEYHRFGAERRRCRMLRYEIDRPRLEGSAGTARDAQRVP